MPADSRPDYDVLDNFDFNAFSFNDDDNNSATYTQEWPPIAWSGPRSPPSYDFSSSPPRLPTESRSPRRITTLPLFGRDVVADSNNPPQYRPPPQPSLSATPSQPHEHRGRRLPQLDDPRPSSFGYLTDNFFPSPPPPRRRSPSTAERQLLHHNPWRTQPSSNRLPTPRPSSHLGQASSQQRTADAANMPPTSAAHNRKHSLPSQASPPAKRARQTSSASRANHTEEIDLASDDNAAQDLLDKEREELVKTQQSKHYEEKPKRLGEMNCIICLDNFTNVTATACGHVFCHECLTQALIAGERANERAIGTCPMCRKPLKRTTKSNLIPLALMTREKWLEVNKR